jgi:uncharacterized iron-regulated membrane protein
MGLIPIFLMIAFFFMIWAGVIYYTFKNYRAQALAAQTEREATRLDALVTLPTPDLLAQGRKGQLPTPAWQAEYAWRTARYRYHKLLREAPYKVFARWYGFRELI